MRQLFCQNNDFSERNAACASARDTACKEIRQSTAGLRFAAPRPLSGRRVDRAMKGTSWPDLPRRAGRRGGVRLQHGACLRTGAGLPSSNALRWSEAAVPNRRFVTAGSTFCSVTHIRIQVQKPLKKPQSGLIVF